MDFAIEFKAVHTGAPNFFSAKESCSMLALNSAIPVLCCLYVWGGKKIYILYIYEHRLMYG